MTSYLLLALGVLSYGVDGVLLSLGSQDERGALRSRVWWLGTVMQATGFLLTFASRAFLPLLVVQTASTAALAVTALLQQVLGHHRLRARDWGAIALMVAGLAVLAATTPTGPVRHVTPGTQPLLALVVIASLLALLPRLSATGSLGAPLWGVLSGVGFGVGAIGARLLASQGLGQFWMFWRWGLGTWASAILMPLGIGIGQLFLTRGLATGRSVTTLGTMYAMGAIGPILVGWLMMDELPRPGAWPLTLLGIAATLVASSRLVKTEATTAVEAAPLG